MAGLQQIENVLPPATVQRRLQTEQVMPMVGSIPAGAAMARLVRRVNIMARCWRKNMLV